MSGPIVGFASRSAAGIPAPVLRHFLYFFVSIGCLALLSAPDATNDEMFHAANIWCAQGERIPYCQDQRLRDAFPSAMVSFDAVTCQRDSSTPLACPTDQSGFSYKSIDKGNLYPQLFYVAMSWLVVPSFQTSIVLLRLFNALVASLLLAVIAVLLPIRYRRALFLMMFVLLPSTGYFLLGSINPSSWAALGVGFGWLPIHAAVNSENVARGRKICLIAIGALLSLMAIGSRWDSIPFVIVVLGLVTVQLLMRIFPSRAATVICLVAFSFGLAVILTRNIVPVHIAPVRFVSLLTSYSAGEPDNLSFYTEQILQSVPNAALALGNLPTTSGPLLPQFIGITNLLIAGFIVQRTFNRISKWQVAGTLTAFVAITVAIAAQVDLIDFRDQGGVEPRYVFPLLLFAGGWWFVNSPFNLPAGFSRQAKFATHVAVVIFAYTTFSIAERYTDRTSGGIRFIPDGPDQWWWTIIPIGPNVILAISVICFAIFISGLRRETIDPIPDRA